MTIFVISPAEAESAANQLGVSVFQLLPSLVYPAKSFALPPISKFHVGAIGLGSSGRIFLGVNVESPGLLLHHSIHVEQFLVTNLTLNDERHLRHFAVSAAPWEHCQIRDASEIKLVIIDPNATVDSDTDSDGFLSLGSRLPHRFGPEDLLDKDFPLVLEHHDNNLTISDLDPISNGNTVELKRTAPTTENRS
ncbi:hypothetical protein HID58_008865 [Brassica napus]|uniref:CMP/dCMP-type deaminase domain-containing protein n=1 Tax=Brassica napus TaxID=3708 RepID=A0ABQ8DSS9_BRANA|nr:hypothetical protein HID58_008865 [Brassica napus]